MYTITTNEAKCRDCYRCIRSCPVKAIRTKVGDEGAELHVQIVEELCVLDGRCVQVCPQKAKKVSRDLDAVKELIASGKPVAASVAPSFVAALPLADPDTLPTILKRLGFKYVQETSLGAELVAMEHRRMGFDKALISSACPVVVNLIEKHYPQLLSCLAPVVSPMVAHGRYIKKQRQDFKVVFIGPCIAKKHEATDTDVADAVDYVLGFNELWEWIQGEGIEPSQLKAGDFDGPQPGITRLFPLDGGMVRSLSLSADMLETRVIAITGLKNCIDFLGHLAKDNIDNPPKLMELLACSGGCIGGPLVISQEDIYVRRQKVIDFYKNKALRNKEDCSFAKTDAVSLAQDLLKRKYFNKKLLLAVPSEADLQEILAQTGKYRPEDELNCGSCGYNTCRDKAVAVYQGRAEVEMCIPYMRKRAESTSNLVLNTMPNGVLIVNGELEIVEINPAAEQMFKCTAKDVLGRKLSMLINPVNFEQVLKSKTPMNVLHAYPEHDIMTREVIFPLEREDIVVGILVDITDEYRQREQLNEVKSQTIKRAQDVIEKQMKVAQEIAGLLGETTAETKVSLSQLIKLMKN